MCVIFVNMVDLSANENEPALLLFCSCWDPAEHDIAGRISDFLFVQCMAGLMFGASNKSTLSLHACLIYLCFGS